MKKRTFFSTFFTAIGILFGGSNIVHADNTDQNHHEKRPDSSTIQPGHKHSSAISKVKIKESKSMSPVHSYDFTSHKHHNDKITPMQQDSNAKKNSVK